MPDTTTTLTTLRAAVAAFVAERDWAQFHNAKDLAVSFCIEAAELLEEFQWHDVAQVSAASRDPEALERTRLELADILVYCLCLSNALEIDVSQAVQDKLALAERKYPAEAYHGRARKPGQGEKQTFLRRARTGWLCPACLLPRLHRRCGGNRSSSARASAVDRSPRPALRW